MDIKHIGGGAGPLFRYLGHFAKELVMREGHNTMSVDQAFHEVYHNVPRSVRKTGKTGKAKRDMMIAIALSKAGKSRK